METHEKEIRQQSWKNKTVAFGILVLFGGVVLLLHNLKILPSEYSRVFFSWQMLIIAIGFINTLGNSKIWGILLILVGGIFLTAKIYGVDLNFWKVAVPTFVILIGVALLFSSFSFFSKRRIVKLGDSDDLIEDVAVFAGSDRSIHSDSFKGGKILAIFGGSKLNMTKVQLAPEVNELEIVCVFGGVSLVVPDDWNIKVEVFNIFGGYEDKRNPALFNKDKILVIKGVTVFGGGEVKSY